jgi:hypothetical protein
VKFCEFCGAELDLDYDNVAMNMVRETEAEKVNKIEEEMMGFLVLAVFVFIVAVTVYLVIPPVPKVDIVPAFQQTVEKKAQTSETIPLLKKKIPE